MRKQRRSAVVGAWIAAGTLGVGGVLASVPASATVRPHASSSGWHQLSSGTVPSTTSIGVARFGSSVQAVWVQDFGTDTGETLRTRVVSSDGAPTSAQVAVVSGWSQLSGFPAVFANGKQRVIAFSGIQNTDPQNPYKNGYEYYLTSSDGTSWALSQGALSEHTTAYSSEGTDAVDAGGTPVVGYTDPAPTAVEYHQGFIATIPQFSGPEQQTTPTSSCCTYDTGLGYDAKAQKTWAVWYSNANQGNANGIFAQPIEPTLGAQSIGPNSFTVSGGDFSSLPPDQRIVTAARVGGGVYAAYVVGYPSASKVALWKLGAAKAKTHSAGGSVGHVGVAAAPKGKIWLYWWNNHTHTIDATLSNSAVSSFGPVCHATTPNKTTNIWDLVGNAAKGPLQLFTLAGSQTHPQVYDRVIKPC